MTPDELHRLLIAPEIIVVDLADAALLALERALLAEHPLLETLRRTTEHPPVRRHAARTSSAAPSATSRTPRAIARVVHAILREGRPARLAFLTAARPLHLLDRFPLRLRGDAQDGPELEARPHATAGPCPVHPQYERKFLMTKHYKAALALSAAVATALVGQVAQASTWTQLSLGTMPLATYSSALPNNNLVKGANLLPIMPYWNITTSDEHIIYTFEFSLLTDAHHSSGDSVNPGNHLDNYSNSAGTWSTVDDYVHGLYTDGISMFAWTEQDTTGMPCTTGYCQLWQGTLGGSLSTEVDNGLYVTSFVDR